MQNVIIKDALFCFMGSTRVAMFHRLLTKRNLSSTGVDICNYNAFCSHLQPTILVSRRRGDNIGDGHICRILIMHHKDSQGTTLQCNSLDIKGFKRFVYYTPIIMSSFSFPPPSSLTHHHHRQPSTCADS